MAKRGVLEHKSGNISEIRKDKSFAFAQRRRNLRQIVAVRRLVGDSCILNFV